MEKATKIKAAVLRALMDLRIEEVPMPECGDNDVLVQIRSVGICGSDVHFWKAGRIGSSVVKFPLILGHESSGRVVEVGKNVADLMPGDRVVLEPGVPCGHCRYCREGHYNLCPECRFMASPSGNGALVEYFAHPAEFTYKIPESMSYEEGVMVEPVNVAVRGIMRAGVRPGSSLLIAGAGTIGLCMLLVARASGATKIYLSDINPRRLELAKRLGATEVIDVSKAPMVGAVEELTGGEGVDFTMECSGVSAVARDAVSTTRRGGTILLVGMFHEDEFPFPIMSVIRREIDIKPLFRYANTYRIALDMVSTKLVDPNPIVTHHFPLEETPEAIRWMMEGREGAIKIMVDVSKDRE